MEVQVSMEETQTDISERISIKDISQKSSEEITTPRQIYVANMGRAYPPFGGIRRLHDETFEVLFVTRNRETFVAEPHIGYPEALAKAFESINLDNFKGMKPPPADLVNSMVSTTLSYTRKDFTNPSAPSEELTAKDFYSSSETFAFVVDAQDSLRRTIHSRVRGLAANIVNTEVDETFERTIVNFSSFGATLSEEVKFLICHTLVNPQTNVHEVYYIFFLFLLESKPTAPGHEHFYRRNANISKLIFRVPATVFPV